ncbi:AP-5 complex subunit mu-like [Cucurbita pepo subsp. pepo]|uniref:AP-5 complex subunit mu-like n=1 Tax=Cucurbita pepo subsp. pepo TaxID=3664 RepID=UPI000C9D726A|nr:AP-5 complex subunit mu-like [Cucurbita pepo subsp. pepo]
MEGYKAPLSMEFCTQVDEGSWEKVLRQLFLELSCFSPWQIQSWHSSSSASSSVEEADSDVEAESASDVVSIEELLMEKMSKDLPPVELEEPFCWQAYNYAKVSIYPAVKAPVEISTQVTPGDYILWNILSVSCLLSLVSCLLPQNKYSCVHLLVLFSLSVHAEEKLFGTL